MTLKNAASDANDVLLCTSILAVVSDYDVIYYAFEVSGRRYVPWAVLGALLETLVLSCTATYYLKIVYFSHSSFPPLPNFPLEFHGEVKRLQKPHRVRKKEAIVFSA